MSVALIATFAEVLAGRWLTQLPLSAPGVLALQDAAKRNPMSPRHQALQQALARDPDRMLAVEAAARRA
jgi:hypothetical protein